MADTDTDGSVYFDDDLVVYRASGVGGCVRALWAARRGMSPVEHPDWLMEKFAEGVRAEPVILDLLTEHLRKIDDDADCFDFQQEIEIPVLPNVIIRGHIDAKARLHERTKLIEVKALAESTYERLMSAIDNGEFADAFPQYAYQLSCYMQALKLEGLLVVGIKDENGDVARIDLRDFAEPPVPLRRIKKRIVDLERMAEDMSMPACSVDLFPCQFYYLHDSDATVVNTDVDLGNLAREYVLCSKSERDARERKREIAEQIRKLLEVHGVLSIAVEVVDSDGKVWRIKWVESDANVFDVKAARKEDQEFVQRFSKVQKRAYPKVTERDQEQSEQPDQEERDGD
ncbi:MAG: hypothetical protein KatS3mg015_2917 [Fimbriimonadales bacterium]|nr:MAG: hypothetical protein KatS3mg015_2917 [Fimbriimonadales bacterium]